MGVPGQYPATGVAAEVVPGALVAASDGGIVAPHLGALSDSRNPVEACTLAGKTAVAVLSYYYLHGQHESGYNDQDVGRLKAAAEAFNAMATRSGLEILRPAGCKASGAVTADTVGRGDAARARVLETLDALIRKR